MGAVKELPAVLLSPADILTVKELASRLKVKPAWVYEQMRPHRKGGLPAFKMGRYLRFSWPEVSAWLQSKRNRKVAA